MSSSTADTTTTTAAAAATTTTTEDQLVTLFTSFNLSESKAKETIKNATLSKRLESIANEAIKNGFSLHDNGKLFYHLASKMKSPQHDVSLELLVKYIGQNKLNTVQRIDAALEYLLYNYESHEFVNVAAFELACGVGVTVTTKDVHLCVRLAASLYTGTSMNVKNVKAALIREVQKRLKWADGKMIVEEIDRFLAKDWPTFDRDRIFTNGSGDIHAEHGSSSSSSTTTTTIDDDGQQRKSKDKSKTNKKAVVDEQLPVEQQVSILDVMKKLILHKPGENYITDGYVVTENTDRLLKAHLAATKGKVRTRFPPEPNGILHVGHAKAININFGYAAAHNGICFLRYDDTNPEKEEEKFFVGIRQMVEWLGYKPYKITHSSDYFDRLYELAVKLIEKGLAYVCHQKQDEIKGFNPPASPWRDRSVEENLILFECMKNGLYDEGAATLRMKIVLEEGKQDPVAYRIKYLPHHRTGQKWCIYPTYDYTHCLCDSIENITHSLCTKEFQSRRSAYYWLCNALDLYCPVQWEYGRLNMNYTVVSKRKIARLIDQGYVKDWDDPRLYTLTALKRRGVPSEAINLFCAKVGVTGSQSIVDPHMLDSEVRCILNETASRSMVVMEPLKVKIVNFSTLKLPDTVEVPDYPNDSSKGTHKIQLNEIIFIEKSDFQSSSDNNYRRLTREQTVGLRYAGLIIRVKVVEYDNREQVSTLLVTAEKVTPMNKPRAFVHWVSNPVTVELRLYDRLFFHKNPEDPEQVKDGYLSDVNPNSLTIYKGYADRYLSTDYMRKQVVFQFERTGYFCRDPDSTKTLSVFNQTVTLKEDANK